ncbi:MAG: hypothetical protein EZS28_045804 [Streblomastix strix]|uniref:Uncharacterized protein n=1 Tax=Streblomastix strix TaxID=222440 RepID=A0A5J4TL43_9EUKA|nr:MAG: hypothetical protein EZS28_045804 [Streblomastix strix]
MCFEILGFDIMLCSDLKPHVLEVNHSPSFVADTHLDYQIKERVLSDAIILMDVNKRDRAQYIKNEKNKHITRLYRDINKHALNQGRSSAIPQDKEKIVLPKIIKQKEKQKDSLQPTYSTLEEWEVVDLLIIVHLSQTI